MNMWNSNKPALDFIDVPGWIDSEITIADVAAIVRGGCASGAYMPAVTNHQASQTMAEFGDDVFQFIETEAGELPNIYTELHRSWSDLAVAFLSYAVDLWAINAYNQLKDIIDEHNDDQIPDQIPFDFAKSLLEALNYVEEQRGLGTLGYRAESLQQAWNIAKNRCNISAASKKSTPTPTAKLSKEEYLNIASKILYEKTASGYDSNGEQLTDKTIRQNHGIVG